MRGLTGIGHRLLAIADDPADDDDLRLRKRVGVAAGLLTIFAPLSLPIQAQGHPASFVLAVGLSLFSRMSSGEDEEVRVRRLAAADWQLLRDIRLRSLADAPLAFGSTLEREATKTDADWQRQAAEADAGERAVAVIAEVDGRPVALARGFIGTSDDAELRRVAWLVGVFVEPEWRGRRLGRRVVSEVLAWAREREISEVLLHVGDWNESARRTYESLGFVATGVQIPLAREQSVTESEMRLVL